VVLFLEEGKQERSKYYLEERLALLVVVLSGASRLVFLVLRYLAVPAAEPDGDATVLKAPAAGTSLSLSC
jgi:hypothetical protein